MVRRTVKFALSLIAGLIAVISILIAVGAWAVSSGPVSLAFLTPAVEEVLSRWHPAYRIRVEDTVVAWAGWERALDLRFINVRAVGQDGAIVAQVPEVAVSISAEALGRGLIAAVEIELFYPDMRLRRLPSGKLEISLAGEDGGRDVAIGPALMEMVQAEDPGSRATYLERLRITQARIVLVDVATGRSWQATLDEARLRRTEGGITGELSLSLMVEGERADLALAGDYIAADKTIRLGVSFDDLRPAALAKSADLLRPLAAVDVPLRGTVTLEMAADGFIQHAVVDAQGGDGTIALPPFAAEALAIRAVPPLAVRELAVRGQYSGSGRRFDLEALNVVFVDDSAVHLPEPIDFPMPIAAISGSGRVITADKGTTNATFDLDLQLGGPKLSVIGNIAIGEDGMTVDTDVVLREMRGDDLDRYWPSTVAPRVRNWILANVSGAWIPEVRLGVELTHGDAGIEIRSLEGNLTVEGATVRYLPPMPAVENVSGTGTFDKDGLTLTLSGGQSQGLAAETGTIRIVSLDTGRRLEIDVVANGGVREILKLLNHQPFVYPARIGVDPDQTDGVATVRLGVRFPLVSDLSLDQVELDARADIAGLVVRESVFGREITDGNLSVDIDRNALVADGTIAVGSLDGALKWQENFGADVPFRRQIDLQIPDGEVASLRELDFDGAPFIENHVTGPWSAVIRTVQYDDRRSSFNAAIDVSEATVTLPYLGFNKPPGEVATIEVVGNLDNAVPSTIERFEATAENLSVRGAATLYPDGTLDHIALERLAAGKTDVQGDLSRRADGGWDVVLSGAGLDLNPSWEQINVERPEDIDSAPIDVPFTLTADLDRVWIVPDHPMYEVEATVIREGGLLNLIQVSASVSEGNSARYAIQTVECGDRALEIHSTDAGSTLRALGIFDDMIGGELKIEGIFDSGKAHQPLAGRARVKDYRILNAPFLAKLLSVVALTGIVDSLQDKGIAFSTLDAPFTVDGGTLTFTDARASGTEIGITATGAVEESSRTVNIKGTIVPFYVFNSLLGRIPLIGDVLTGGEKGGGIFAARYTMAGPLEDPEVSINPVSALAPGFLRNLFAIFESGPELPSTKPSVSSPPGPTGSSPLAKERAADP